MEPSKGEGGDDAQLNDNPPPRVDIDRELAEAVAKGAPLSTDMQKQLRRAMKLAAESGIEVPDILKDVKGAFEEAVRCEGPAHERKSGDGLSPQAAALFNAAAEGDIDTIKQLISNDNRHIINEADSLGYTAVMHAAAGDQVAAVNFLVSLKCDLTKRTHNDCIALHFAAKYGNKHICATLARGCPDFIDAFSVEADTPLLWACLEDRFEAVLTLLDHGARTDAVNRYGSSPCHCLVTWSEERTEKAEAEGEYADGDYRGLRSGGSNAKLPLPKSPSKHTSRNGRSHKILIPYRQSYHVPPDRFMFPGSIYCFDRRFLYIFSHVMIVDL